MRDYAGCSIYARLIGPNDTEQITDRMLIYIKCKIKCSREHGKIKNAH